MTEFITYHQDDTLLYRSIHSEQDVIALQDDVNSYFLSQWVKFGTILQRKISENYQHNKLCE